MRSTTNETSKVQLVGVFTLLHVSLFSLVFVHPKLVSSPNFFLLLFSSLLSLVLNFKGTTTKPSRIIVLKSTKLSAAEMAEGKSLTFCLHNSAYAQGCKLNMKLNNLSSPNMLFMYRFKQLKSLTQSLTDLSCFNFSQPKHVFRQELFF